MGFNAAVRGGPGTGDPGRFSYFGGQPLEPTPCQSLGCAGRSDCRAGVAGRRPRQPVYRITATMPADTTREQFLLMLQGLLAERFHLALHHETRDFPGHARCRRAQTTPQDEGVDTGAENTRAAPSPGN